MLQVTNLVQIYMTLFSQKQQKLSRQGHTKLKYMFILQPKQATQFNTT
jgi:hypothetical protein